MKASGFITLGILVVPVLGCFGHSMLPEKLHLLLRCNSSRPA